MRPTRYNFQRQKLSLGISLGKGGKLSSQARLRSPPKNRFKGNTLSNYYTTQISRIKKRPKSKLFFCKDGKSFKDFSRFIAGDDF